MARSLVSTAFISLALLTSGCASAPGSFTRDNFVWKEHTVGIGYEEVFKRITDGGRRCTGLNHYRPSGYYLAESGSGHFDVFLPSLLGMESNFVGGMIEFAKTGDGGCTVNIGELKKYYGDGSDSTGFYRQIEGYLSDDPTCWTSDQYTDKREGL